MSPLTIFLGKLIGLAMLLMCLSLATRPKSSLATVSAMMEQTGLLMITGMITMTAGLALVVGHDVWSGPPLTFAVTIIGWMTLLKGMAILAVPTTNLAVFYRALNYPRSLAAVMWLGAVIGAWMTWAAFAATPQVAV
jgi:hypothetical protein